MDNSAYDRYDKLLFNIIEVIKVAQSELKNKNLSLMVYLLSEQKSETKVYCIINKIDKENITIQMKLMKLICKVHFLSKIIMIFYLSILLIIMNYC